MGDLKEISGIVKFGPFPRIAKLLDVKSEDSTSFFVMDGNVCEMKVLDKTIGGTLTTDGAMLLWDNGSVWLRTQAEEDRAKAPKVKPARSKSSGPKIKPQGPSLSLVDALQMQEELCRGFSEEVFQKRLKEIERTFGKAYEETTPKHTRLFLTVQSEVLPKYGFTGNSEGVLAMLEAAAVHNSSAEFRAKRQELNLLLGLEPDPSELADMQGARKARAGANGGYPVKQVMPRVSALPNTLSRSVLEPQRQEQRDPAPYEVTLRHAVEDSEVKVTVPGDSTFLDLKEAVGRQLHRPDFAQKARLVGRDNGAFFSHKDSDYLDGTAFINVLSTSLEAAERPRKKHVSAY